MRRTKLPLWYLVGVLVNLLATALSFLGFYRGMKLGNLRMIELYKGINWLFLIAWLLANLFILGYLIFSKIKHKDTKPIDFVFPVYFIAIYIILFSLPFIVVIPNTVNYAISLLTSIFEIIFAVYLIVPFIKVMEGKEVKKSSKKAVHTAHKKAKHKSSKKKGNSRKK
jgi:hypothetical protein